MPQLANVKQQLFVLKDHQFTDGSDPEVKNLHKLVQSINGQTFSTMTMHPGETQLWRFTNQSANLIFNIALKGHRFRIIETDGVVTNQEKQVDTLELLPAGRLEVLVDAGAAGTYDLVSPHTMTGVGDKMTEERVLGQLTVEGTQESTLATQTAFPEKVDWRTKKIDTYRTIVYSQSYDKKSDDMSYYINGQMFDHNRIDTRVPLGNIEEWTIKNNTDDFHSFHIHQIHFQVAEINGKPQPFDNYVDTVRIPERGEVKLILPFVDPQIVGTFVYHCHVLEHEDKGMMQQIEVYDPKESPIRRWWHDMFSCCSSMKFSGGCFGSNIRRLWWSLTTKQI